jgi:leucyl-tRNA synthetase
MAPITPHLSEEIWSRSNNSFISNERYPVFENNEVSKKSEVGEYLIKKVVEDISEILKVTNIKPKIIYIYTSPTWKINLYTRIIKEFSDANIDVGSLIKDLLSNPNIQVNAKEISKSIIKIKNEIIKLSDNDKIRYLVKFSEKEYLNNSIKYLINVFKCDIRIFSGDSNKIEDPMDKVRLALPLKPAIYIK